VCVCVWERERERERERVYVCQHIFVLLLYLRNEIENFQFLQEYTKKEKYILMIIGVNCNFQISLISYKHRGI